MNLLLIIHLLVVVCLSLIIYRMNKSIQGVICIFLCLAVTPFIGPLVAVSYVIYKPIVDRKDVSAYDLIVQQEGVYKFYPDLIEHEEQDVLPLNDVLLVSEDKIKRERFLATLKKDVSSYTHYIRKAVTNEDGETAHYAAAIIQETKRKIDVELQEARKEYQESPESFTVMSEYSNTLKKALEMDFMDEFARTDCLNMYTEVTKKLIYRSHLSEDQLVFLIECVLESGDYQKAKKYGEIYLVKYPKSRLQFITCMKLYYEIKEYHLIMDVIKQFRESDVVFDEHCMSYMRFWMGIME